MSKTDLCLHQMRQWLFIKRTVAASNMVLLFSVIFLSSAYTHAAAKSCKTVLNESAGSPAPQIELLGKMYLHIIQPPLNTNSSDTALATRRELFIKKMATVAAELNVDEKSLWADVRKFVEGQAAQHRATSQNQQLEKAAQVLKQQAQLDKKLRQLDVCSRTPQVRLAIEKRLNKLCDEITLKDLAIIPDLDLSGKDITHLHEDDFYGMTRLRSLSLTSNQLMTLPENIFRNLRSLEYLALGFNNIVVLPEKLVQRCKKLRIFDITHNSDLSSIPANFFRGHTKLGTLSFSYTNVTSFPITLIQDLKASPDLVIRLSGRDKNTHEIQKVLGAYGLNIEFNFN